MAAAGVEVAAPAPAPAATAGAATEAAAGRDRDRSEQESSANEPGPVEPAPLRQADGAPTLTNPGLTIADFGAAPIGVPNFVIDQFTIPPFLLPIYQACGTQYGIPWQVLASINRIETAFGTNLNVSTAGAQGWMQFIPSTWEMYGTDANNDGRKDPYNPVDAICAAARYLNAAGGEEDLRTAIFAYNHADWYVDEVLLYANQYSKLPDDLIGSLTGLTEGARFPVAADSRYADDISERQAVERAKPGQGGIGNVSDTVTSSPTRRGVDIFADPGAPVIAVNDGVIRDIGQSKELGKYVVLQDTYGNRFTYAGLGHLAKAYPAAKERKPTAKDYALGAPHYEGAGDEPAPEESKDEQGAKKDAEDGKGSAAPADDASTAPVSTEDARERIFALPERQRSTTYSDDAPSLEDDLFNDFPNFERYRAYSSGILKFNRKTMELRELEKGSKVVAGTLLGRVGETDELASRVNFSIRPAGRGAPSIDPKPILDGWKLLEATALYRVANKDPFEANEASIGQILLMSKEQLARRVLANPKLEIYECGRQDVQTGVIDRRLLALFEYLTASGFRLTITSLQCGHSIMTASGSVSQHSTGSAVDIAMINGINVLGNQGQGSITEALIEQILRLQGSMTPDQVISLMEMGGPTFAMSDHADHVHVGYAPQYGPVTGSTSGGPQFTQVLKPEQWERLIDRIGEIDNPTVPTSPSDAALPAKQKQKGKGKPASHAHRGE